MSWRIWAPDGEPELEPTWWWRVCGHEEFSELGEHKRQMQMLAHNRYESNNFGQKTYLKWFYIYW